MLSKAEQHFRAQRRYAEIHDQVLANTAPCPGEPCDDSFVCDYHSKTRTLTMSGLWKNDPATPEGKYLVTRRDGSVPEWPHFVIGAKDPCAPAALEAYADEAESNGMDPQFVQDVRDLAVDFARYRMDHGTGDPDAPRHRTDDPATIEKMRGGRSA